MQAVLAEFFGTLILVVLGNGVVANVVLARTKGHGSGLIVITAGWAFAVFVAVVCSAKQSGAHLNSAVTIGLAVAGKFSFDLVPGYLAAQLAGAFVGAMLVYACYRDHYVVTDDADLKLATFCTAPAIKNFPRNVFCEGLGTFVLMMAVLSFSDPTIRSAMSDSAASEPGPVTGQIGLGSIGAIQVGLVVFAIGLSLGGTTGYAINPARDLGPRLAHAVLPISGKRDSDWGNALVPVVGPIVGAILAALVFPMLNG